ncbi:hypothetical protein [Halomonas sp. GD1P12]|uniref:hypothetical protein n=1 Tax=Halomonas sp. GD1P12 TaxID=2982691 RepID=UPI0021E42980|nr:hypothetical protein [Halomonas sp. GD1P12]UYF99363.1 hypothetical protein OCT39_14160 [Halomonas sp. GD1P12]
MTTRDELLKRYTSEAMQTGEYIRELYKAWAHFTGLAVMLERSGHRMAAAEIQREADALGQRANQLEGVLQDYHIDVASARMAAKGLEQ